MTREEIAEWSTATMREWMVQNNVSRSGKERKGELVDRIYQSPANNLTAIKPVFWLPGTGLDGTRSQGEVQLPGELPNVCEPVAFMNSPSACICPKCKVLGNLEIDFGFRTIGGKKVRQSWCRACRKGSMKETAAKARAAKRSKESADVLAKHGLT